MQITVNGDAIEVDAGLSLASLLDRIGKRSEHVAIECNGEVVESDDFTQVTLSPDDKLEIVHFVGGG